MTELNGTEFNEKYPKCELFQVHPVNATSDDPLYHFVFYSGLVPTLLSGNYDQNLVEPAMIPAQATVTINSSDDMLDRYCVHQTDIILLNGKRTSLNEFVKERYITFEDYLYSLKTSSRFLKLGMLSDKLLEEMCVLAVSRDGMALCDVPERMLTKTLCMIAVQQNPAAIKYVPIEMQSKLVCRIADRSNSKLNGFDFGTYGGSFFAPVDITIDESKVIDLIVNNKSIEIDMFNLFTYQMHLDSVTSNGNALRDVPDNMRSEKLVMAAVKNHGFAIRYLQEDARTNEICLAAVKRNGCALKYVPKDVLTEEICLAAVKRNRNALEYVPMDMMNEQVILASIIPPDRNGRFAYIPKCIPEEMLTEQVYLALAKAEVGVLSVIPYEMITEEICLIQVELHGPSIQHIPDWLLTEKICVTAVKKNDVLLKYVPERLITQVCRQIDQLRNN